MVAVAGSSKDYAKSLGADIIVDYREHQGDALVRTGLSLTLRVSADDDLTARRTLSSQLPKDFEFHISWM